MKKETRTYKVSGSPDILDRIERFLSMLHLNGTNGHSGTFCMVFDGDGADGVAVDGIDHDRHKEMVRALSEYGGEYEVVGNGGAFCVNRDQKSKLVYGYREGRMFKSAKIAFFLKSYVRSHTRRLKDGRRVTVGSYHNNVVPKPKSKPGRDDRTGDLFADQKKQDTKPSTQELESELRSLWTEQGVPKERQDALIAQIAEKAKPGAKVGPFYIAGSQDQLEGHPAPIPRQSIKQLQETAKHRWIDLHRRQHEIRYHEKPKLRARIERAQRSVHQAESIYKEAERDYVRFEEDARRGMPGAKDRQERLAVSKDNALSDRNRHRERVNALLVQQENLSAEETNLGTKKDAILPSSGDLRLDLTSGRHITLSEERQRESNYASQYRDWLKRKSPTKALLFRPNISG